MMRRVGVGCLLVGILACTDGSGAGDGVRNDGSSSAGEQNGPGNGTGSNGTAGQGCPLSADKTLKLTLSAADFAPETVESGPSVSWRLSAQPAQMLPALAPGETVAVQLDLSAAPLHVLRDVRNLYVELTFASGGSTFAQADLASKAAFTGSATLGPWSSKVSTNAGGKPIRLTLGAIGINPNEGQALTCVSLRAELPPLANRVSDSSPLSVVASDAMPLDKVRLSLTGDPPTEPFPLRIGE